MIDLDKIKQDLDSEAIEELHQKALLTGSEEDLAIYEQLEGLRGLLLDTEIKGDTQSIQYLVTPTGIEPITKQSITLKTALLSSAGYVSNLKVHQVEGWALLPTAVIDCKRITKRFQPKFDMSNKGSTVDCIGTEMVVLIGNTDGLAKRANQIALELRDGFEKRRLSFNNRCKQLIILQVVHIREYLEQLKTGEKDQYSYTIEPRWAEVLTYKTEESQHYMLCGFKEAPSVILPVANFKDFYENTDRIVDALVRYCKTRWLPAFMRKKGTAEVRLDFLFDLIECSDGQSPFSGCQITRLHIVTIHQGDTNVNNDTAKFQSIDAYNFYYNYLEGYSSEALWVNSVFQAGDSTEGKEVLKGVLDKSKGILNQLQYKFEQGGVCLIGK